MGYLVVNNQRQLEFFFVTFRYKIFLTMYFLLCKYYFWALKIRVKVWQNPQNQLENYLVLETSCLFFPALKLQTSPPWPTFKAISRMWVCRTMQDPGWSSSSTPRTSATSPPASFWSSMLFLNRCLSLDAGVLWNYNFILRYLKLIGSILLVYNTSES